MFKAKIEAGMCQVRSRTDSPCPRQAVVEIRGIPFCEQCAREQEAYFAIGELTQGTQSLRDEPLLGALERMRRKRLARAAVEEVDLSEVTVGSSK